MVTRPGRTVPVLMHMRFAENSNVPDQQVLAVFMNEKWYVLDNLDFDGKAGQSQDQSAATAEEFPLVQDIMSNLLENIGNIHSLDDFLDLFTTSIPGGEVLELPSTGLETVVLPEPAEDPEEIDPALLEQQKPGKKSRPKL